MSVTRWGFESGSAGDNLTGGNSGSDFPVVTGGTATIETAQAAHGTRSALFTATSTSGGCYISKAITATDVLGADVYMRITALPSADVGILWFGTGTVQRLNLELTTTGALRIRDDAITNIWTSSTTMSLNTWYRISLYATRDPSTGTVRAAYYALDSTTAIADSGLLTGRNTGAASYDSIRIGTKTSTATVTMTAYVDDWGYDPAATGLLPPVGSNTSPTVDAGSNQNVAASATVNLSASASDPDGSIASYAWSFLYPTSGAPSLTGGTTATPSFTAGAAGNLYVLQVQVTDNGGATATDTVEVRVPLGGAVEMRPLAGNGTGVGSWTIAGGSASDGAALNDASDSTYIESPTLSATETTRRVRLQPSDPKASASIKDRLWTDTGTANVTARLYEGTTLRQAFASQAINSTPTEYTFTLSAGTITAIGDWGNLYLEIGATT
jgi:hypothetical protein